MPALRIGREIRGFLGKLQYINTHTPGRSLLLYLLVSDIALVCMSTQLNNSGNERVIYYLSKRMLDYETRYVMIECFCLALVWTTRRLRHYMTEYSMHLISRLDPLRYFFYRSTLVGRLIRCLSGWCMYFDGAANHSGYGIGVLLISPHGDHIPRSVRLGFSDRHPATNNIVEYEACILGLEIAFELRIRQMEVFTTRFLIYGETLYKQSANRMLLLCLDYVSADREMREVHAGVCGPHMKRHMKISPKSSNGHEFIFVAIDYFTKWIEAALYARLTSSRVASFIISHIIYHYGVPHELISNRKVHFRIVCVQAQTNKAIKSMNKNIKRILRRIVETSRDWSEKLHFALWTYRTSFRTFTGATLYSLVYGMKAMLPIEIEMGSLRVAFKQHISKVDLAQARLDQLNLLDERRLRVVDHVHAYQRKMAYVFKKRVKPRPLQRGLEDHKRINQRS
ncbi:hypothetical protein AAG906_016109 [Vitis piasezkii]